MKHSLKTDADLQSRIHIIVCLSSKYIYLFTRASGQTHGSGHRRRHDVPFAAVTGSGWLQPSFPGKENKDRNHGTEIEKETAGTILEK